MGKMNKIAPIYNGPVELATRIAFIVAFHRVHQLDLSDLVCADYVLLYSSEFGGPKNLHPATPNRLAELIHRREKFPMALSYLLGRGLLNVVMNREGVSYIANFRTSQFAKSFDSSYHNSMVEILKWMAKDFDVRRFKEEGGVFNDHSKN